MRGTKKQRLKWGHLPNEEMAVLALADGPREPRDRWLKKMMIRLKEDRIASRDAFGHPGYREAESHEWPPE